jgi:hypothetical protein
MTSFYLEIDGGRVTEEVEELEDELATVLSDYEGQLHSQTTGNSVALEEK